MPFARPTLTQIRDGALQDVAAQQIYDGATGQVVNPILLQFDPLTILAKVLAGLAYELYGYLDYIALQATPATAKDESALAWGALVGDTPKPATAAAGLALGSGPAGDDIPLGTQFARSDGFVYATTVDVEIPASGSVIVPFQAITTGSSGTIATGSTLTIQSEIAGVTKQWLVSGSTAPGTDLESQDAFRTRYLQRYAAPPSGGTLSDYEEWALAVPGVTRAWSIGNVNGPGTVGVYVMLDVSEAANNGFPVGSNGISPLDNDSQPRDSRLAAGDQLTVANAIVSKQPVTDLTYVLAPTPFPIAFSVANLGTANTAANQAAITAALAAVCVTIGDPRGTVIDPSNWNAAIASVLGNLPFTLAAPTAPVGVPSGSLPTVMAPTYSP